MIIMSEILNNVLELSFKMGYLKSFNMKNGVCSLSFGPLAMLLATNVFNEWFHYNVSSSDMNVNMYESQSSKNWIKDCQSSYQYSLQLVNNQLPFGLVTKFDSDNLNNEINESAETIFQFTPQSKGYRKLVFIDPKKSQHYFYRLQNRRKMWWRKYSTDPQKFSLIECETKGEEKVEIRAKLPWSSDIVETIQFHKNDSLSKSSSRFEIKWGRKKILPDVIECVSLEGPVVMTHLGDSFQQCSDRVLLGLHPRLAPYKVALAVNPQDENIEDIYQLAEFLNANIRTAGIPTLFAIGNIKTNELKEQFTTNDMMGIPYTILVSADALCNGIVRLRSRDTTLQEEVHVSHLVSYLERLLKSSLS